MSRQHLIDVVDLDGWQVVSETSDSAVLERTDGTRHACVLDDRPLSAVAASVRRCAPDPRPGKVRFGDANWEVGVATQVVEAGAALIIDVPTERGMVLQVADDLGFVRATNYGVLFDVESVASPNNLAYSARALPLHTDNPYRDPTPTVQLLHCLRPSATGGETILADGFSAAEALRSTRPDAFDVLATVPVRFRFADATTNLASTRSIIEVGTHGVIQAVHMNHRSMLAPPPDSDVEAFYDAYRAFAALCSDNEYCASFTLAAGELVVFDNRRTLHARGEFPAGDGRHLQGCYIDIDALTSTAALARGAVE